MPTGVPTKAKACAICNETFIPEKPSQKICKKEHINHCPICGKEIVWNSTRPVKPCSKECSKELTRRKNIEKYGVPHPMQNDAVKRHFTDAMIQKYGVAHALQNDDIKQAAIETNREKFGCDWGLSNPDIKEKSLTTMRERYGAATTLESPELRAKVKSTLNDNYGVDNPMQSDIIRNRAKTTNLSQYGAENAMQSEMVRNKVHQRHISKYQKQWKDIIALNLKDPIDWMLYLNNIEQALYVPEFREQLISELYQKSPTSSALPDDLQNLNLINTSDAKLKFSQLLSKNNIPHIMGISIGGTKYDFQIMGTNVLIDIDDTERHNLIGNFDTPGLNKNYHTNKSIEAQKAGYRCIHVFDWDDIQKVMSLLIINTPIYARDCVIKEMPLAECNKFLNRYHLQNTCRMQKIRLGLFRKDELLQVMTFGKPRYSRVHQWELLRLCTKSGICVLGGSQKLFKYFIRKYNPESVISYCDASKFMGEVYLKLGMKYIHTTPPQLHWSKEDEHISRTLLNKVGYNKLFKTETNFVQSNEYLMLQDRWLPVCDCGQFVFEYKKDTSD